MKRTLTVVGLTVGLATVLTCGASGAAWALPTDAPYANCTAAMAAGRVDIPRGDPAYAARLDRDDDGRACESDDPASSETGDQATADQDTADQASGAGGGGQVTIVPEGAAPTGDGSAAGAGSRSWWVGSLLTALAGVGFRRPRVAAGR